MPFFTKKGGIYLDIDSLNITKLDSFLLPSDTENFFVQWALLFEAGHPFLKKTLELVIENLKENKYPHDVHKMTGPTAYSAAINACLNDQPDVRYRKLGVDYDGYFKFHYSLSKLFFYGLRRKNQWKKRFLF